MSDRFHELDELPPAMRRRIMAAAEVSGLDLSAFLHQLMSPEEAAPVRGSARQGSENFAYRHRVEALERRLGASTAGLEAALRSVESSALSLEARVCDAEGLALETRDATREHARAASAELTLLQRRLADAERDGLARWQSAENTAADFAGRLSRVDQHMDFVEDIAKGAHQTGALLAEAHHALKHALAEDFAEFALDTAANIEGGLQALREDSVAAAARADAALQALKRDLHEFATKTEQGVEQSAAETRARMREAFVATEAQLAALADRLSQTERAGAFASESLAAQLAALGEAHRATLENLAADLREADAEREADIVAREQRVAGRLDRIELAHAAHSVALGDNIARVEACTLAALEKLSADITGVDGKLSQKLETVTAATSHALEQLETDLASLHGQHCGVAARLHLIDRTLGMAVLAQEADPPVAERLATLEKTQAEQQLRLEKALDKTSINRELNSLRGDVADLGKRVEDVANDASLAQKLEDMRVRIDEQTEQNTDLVRSLSRVSAKSAGAAAHAEDRLRKLEQAAGGAQRFAAQVAVVESRIAEVEAGQSAAFEQLRADIAGFVERQERRIAAIEANDPSARLEAIAALIEQWPAPAATPDFVAEFDALRQRLEARIHDMDGRNIRTLEQVSETIALLEQRFNARSEQRMASSA